MRCWAHPRSRGEHSKMAASWHVAKGSSPLARGTRAQKTQKRCHKGLIPARAGNTDSLTETQERAWAHPRSRGEHHSKRSLSRTSMGSSPLARGTRTQGDARAAPAGLIPARAGNTQVSPPPRAVVGAHPRSRGEHQRIDVKVSSEWGSSPLARGTLGEELAYGNTAGLIPARAGNTPI